MKTVKLKMASGKRKGSGVLTLQGNLTLDCVEEILHFFRDAVSRYNHLEVRAADVSSLDLGFLQLLYSLEMEQSKRDFELAVVLRLESDLEQLLRNTGFAHWLAEPKAKEK